MLIYQRYTLYSDGVHLVACTPYIKFHWPRSSCTKEPSNVKVNGPAGEMDPIKNIAFLTLL